MLVVRVDGAPPPPRRRIGRQRPREADRSRDQVTVPLTSLTVIRPDDLGDERAAETWLAEARDDRDAIDAEIAGALELINAAVHAHRAAALDPAIADVAAHAALTVRIGFGTGEQLADGEFERALEIPVSERRRRAEVLRPQERVAEVLGGREGVAACELLLIRARADLDAGRSREAALQLQAGVESLLAERDALAAPDQEGDFAALEERREGTGAAAAEATGGALGPERLEQVTETLRIAERVLRRKRALG